MCNNQERAAVLIMDQPDSESGICLDEGMKLYEKMTTKGSYGPSTIFFMAPGGIKYSDCEPGIDELENIFLSLKEEDLKCLNLLLFICSEFDESSFDLGGERVTSDELGRLLEPLKPHNVSMILQGSNSHLFGPKLQQPGRIIIFIDVTDSENPASLNVNGLITGDSFTMRSYMAERDRLAEKGVSLIMHSM